MHYKMDEILLLENLTYFENDFPLVAVLEAKGKTVREYLDSIELEKIDPGHDYAHYMTGTDFRNLILAMKNNDKISDAKIIETHYDEAYGGGGGVSVIFLNEDINEAVVAFRGTAANEWADDFIASNQMDSLQQINALEWYKRVVREHHLQDYMITVTGHSKGGNKAKYVTILDDSVDRCFSFDGQGFSDVFMENYKDRIILRQEVIQNHNIDFDYVNIILNDIGEKYYYFGYNYGRGGFAEAHCPNTFFDFTEDGEYEIRINPEGQRPEMQMLDQFINSLSRSDFSDRDRTETARLIGILVEKAFAIGSDEKHTAEEYINTLCNLIRDEVYSDNTAYILAFVIKYSQKNPAFLKALKDIMSSFGMDAISDIIDTAMEIVGSKKINRIVNLSSFLAVHMNGITTKTVQSVVKKKTGLELSRDQVQGLLMVVSMTRETLPKINLDMDGSDIDYSLEEPEEEDEDEDIDMEGLDIVVLAGGLSSQRNISLKAGTQIVNTLKELGHNVILLDSFWGYGEAEERIEDPFADPEKYSLNFNWKANGAADLWAVKKRRADKSDAIIGPNVIEICKHADITFIALQGASAGNGKLQATLDSFGIPYTGCDYFSSSVTSNRAAARCLMEQAGVPVAKGYSQRKGELRVDPESRGLRYPVVVKPCYGDTVLDIFVVSSFSSYKKALRKAFTYTREVMVEEYLNGREFCVSTLNKKALPVIEILPLNTKDVETDADLLGRAVKKCPADISPSLAGKLKSAALTVSQVLGCNAYSRVTFIVFEDESFVCLECDSLPDLSMEGQFYLEAQANQMSYPDFIGKILQMAVLEKN